MEITFKIKRFNELSTAELYSVLQLRSEVFVVEQNCVYQDIDDKDVKALHVLGYCQNELTAYSRLFDAGNYFEEAKLLGIAHQFQLATDWHTRQPAGI
jgi:ElaA protein